MQLGVLGPLQIRFDGTEIELGAPKLRALLVSLLLDAGRVVPVDRLVDDLWGEDPPDRALVSLRSYVSNLRRALPAPGDRSLVVTRGRGYLLDVDPEVVDAVRFERHARAGRDLLATDPTAALDELDRGLRLWRGPALADVADLPVARGPATRLEELRLAATEDRLEALLATGRPGEVVAEAEALAAAHPLRERPRALQMTALYRTGRAPDALAVHRAFREHLADELGLDPSPRLDALADAMLRRDPSLDGPDATAPPVATAAETLATSAPEGLLVGRAYEQEVLAELLAGVAAGRGGVAVVSGEPGIGKTALVRWLEHRAEVAGVPVVWGRCHETGGAPAFWPFTQVLRALSEQADDARLAAEVAGAAAGVVQLVPELAERTGQRGDVGGADPHAARFALHEAALTFLGRRASDRGLVVVIDDLHWADAASLELVALLAGRVRTSRVLLVVTHRDAAADRTPDLDGCLAAVAREPAAEALYLSGLAPDDVQVLVAELDVTATPEVIAGVHRRAGGNPFFVHQLARLHAESGDRLAAEAVPVGVRHVLLRRLQLVPTEVRSTLDVAAVLGQDVEARPLASARGLPLGEVLDHLDVAADHGLVEAVAGATSWRFVHALIRDTVLDELPPGRLARLHLTAADALEELASPPAGAIADHLWHSADLVDPDRPVAWLRAAAEDALAVFAFEEGERLLRRALHLLAHHAAPRTELAVRLRLVQVLTGMHGWASRAVVEVADRARELAGVAGIGPDLVSLWWPLWSQYMTCGQLVEARESARDLLADVVRDGTPAALVAGHVAVAYTGMFAGMQHDVVIDHVAAGEQHVVDADPQSLATTPEHLGVALRITRGLAHALHGDAEEAIAGIDAAVAEAVAVDNLFSEAYARMFGGFAGAALDLPEVGRDFTVPGLAICERAGLVHLANLTIPTHGWACARLGEDPRHHGDRIQQALEDLAATGHRHALPMWWALLGEVRLLAGDHAAAVAALARGRHLAEEIGEVAYARQFARVASLLGVPAPT